MKTHLLSAIAMLTLAAPALANEGFDLNPPPSLQNAWNNSVWIQLKSKEGGYHSASATILREQKIGDKYYLFVLTCGHIASDLGWQPFQAVSASSGLPAPILYKNVTIPQTPTVVNGESGVLPAGPSTMEPLPVDLKFVWGILSIAPNTSVIDAGILVYEENHPFPGLVPLQIADVSETAPGDDVFEIGFPAVALRPDSAQVVKIPEDGVMTKRISQGKLIGTIGPATDKTIAVLGATNDVLLGNSGGALFNKAGHIIGVVSFMYSSDQNAWAYVPDAFFSVGFAMTDVLKKFVDENLDRFVQGL